MNFAHIKFPTKDDFFEAADFLTQRALSEALLILELFEFKVELTQSENNKIKHLQCASVALLGQAVELYLKGMIAAESPEKLLYKNKTNRRLATDKVSDFHKYISVKVSGLLDLYREVCQEAPSLLPVDFEGWLQQIRDDRNAIVHSPYREKFEITNLIERILKSQVHFKSPGLFLQERLDTISTVPTFRLTGGGDDKEGRALIFGRLNDDVEALISVLPNEIVTHLLGVEYASCIERCHKCFSESCLYFSDEMTSYIKTVKPISKSPKEVDAVCILCENESLISERCPNDECGSKIINKETMSCDWCAALL